jgi:enoyl-CoA hydratase
MFTSVVVARTEAIVDVTLNSPESGNMLTPEMGDAVEQALLNLKRDIKPVRFRGVGDHFCRGRKSPPIDRSTATALAFRDAIADPPLRLYQAFRACRAPILGLVQGEALGVGCALAALCDLTIASATATFAIPEMDHGIAPTLVISALTGRLPYKAISHLVYSREQISAQEAATLGIVGKVVAPDALDSAGEELVKKMLTNTPAALQGVKEYLRHAATLDPSAQAALASTILATVLSSQHR